MKPSQAAKKAGSTKEALGRAVTDGGREPRPAENAGKMEQTRNAGNAKKTESVGLEAGGPGEGAQVGHDMCRELDRLRAEVTVNSYVMSACPTRGREWQHVQVHTQTFVCSPSLARAHRHVAMAASWEEDPCMSVHGRVCDAVCVCLCVCVCVCVCVSLCVHVYAWT